jgi:hypothetical protein
MGAVTAYVSASPAARGRGTRHALALRRPATGAAPPKAWRTPIPAGYACPCVTSHVRLDVQIRRMASKLHPRARGHARRAPQPCGRRPVSHARYPPAPMPRVARRVSQPSPISPENPCQPLAVLAPAQLTLRMLRAAHHGAEQRRHRVHHQQLRSGRGLHPRQRRSQPVQRREQLVHAGGSRNGDAAEHQRAELLGRLPARRGERYAWGAGCGSRELVQVM